jgi:hypothetical protein
MTRKKDSENKRMRQLKFSAEKSERIKTIFQSLKDSGAPPALLSDAWEKTARRALHIEPMKEFLSFDPKQGRMISQKVPADWVDPVADSMRRTFEMFKLDPSDPWSWRLLVGCLSMIYFWKPPRKKSGRPKTWTPELNAQLEQAAAAFHGVPNTEVVKRLTRKPRFPLHKADTTAAANFSTFGQESLRKRLGKVRPKPPSRRTKYGKISGSF